MRIIFCDSGFSPKEVDYMYVEEYEFAKKNFIQTSLISFEQLKKGNIESALRRVKAVEQKEIGIYRGWMMKPKLYETFYLSLLEKNIELINDPSEYKFSHYLPENYETIKSYTPKTTFKKLDKPFQIEDFKNEIDIFKDKPIIIKDYVKSQKHYWEEACFIPNASDVENVKSVIHKFLELQDSDLNEGLVFREYIELEKLTNHSESGMPLTKEFRVFILHGRIMTTYEYWDEGNYENVQPIFDSFEELLPRIASKFFTMDIAKKNDGNWIIVELGDGQVSGLPDNANKDEFYDQLKKREGSR